MDAVETLPYEIPDIAKDNFAWYHIDSPKKPHPSSPGRDSFHPEFADPHAWRGQPVVWL